MTERIQGDILLWVVSMNNAKFITRPMKILK